MSLTELSLRQAVLDAIREFDELGRENFLLKYGFGMAREYMLVYEGRLFDSKAIVGVAHGKQFGTVLSAESFSGGQGSVAPKLKSLGFEVISKRSPDWTRDELILALDLYFRSGVLGQSHPDVAALSAILNGLPLHAGWRFTPEFRNGSSVSMKLANFKALDVAHLGIGLTSVGKADSDIWDEFRDHRDALTALASVVRSAALGADVAEVEVDEEGALEGRLLFRVHRARERDRELVRRKKVQYRAANSGKLCCEVCGFDFEAVYGERGTDYAECHHVVPLSESGPTKTRLSDLAVVCVNCHRMIHVRRPTLTVAELRTIVQSQLGHC
jgi:5-methylcytosine-specific restriction enzyme A